LTSWAAGDIDSDKEKRANMNKLFRALSICSQIALAVLLLSFAGGRIVQEADGWIPYLHSHSAGASSLRRASSDVSKDVSKSERRACSEDCRSYPCGEYNDMSSDGGMMPRSSLSPSMCKLEKAIVQMRAAGQEMADAAATDDGTLDVAATHYREALDDARIVLDRMRLRMDDQTDFYCGYSEDFPTAFIGRRGQIKFQADELRLLGVQ